LDDVEAKSLGGLKTFGRWMARLIELFVLIAILLFVFNHLASMSVPELLALIAIVIALKGTKYDPFKF
jgi:membrane-bound ClpP family serine protease